MKIYLLSLTLLMLFFGACSTKEVFSPENIEVSWSKYGDNNDTIVDVTSDIALLESRTVLSKDRSINVKVEESFRLLGKSDGWIISSNDDGNMTLQSIEDNSSKEHFELKKSIAAASVKNDTLAVLFADNEMALYAVSTKELILKEQGNAPMVVDSRIVNPFFMNDLVLFLTLDGKIVIINVDQKKKLRTIIVSSEEYFNNIIYFNVVDNKLIAATGHKMLSLAEKEIRVNYEIRNMTFDDTNIFITTKQGEIISLTPDLQVNAKAKFPFAHFLGVIATEDKIYLLEKEGYIIELSKDLLVYTIYEVDIADGYVYVGDKMFYINDEYISVK